MFLDKKFIGQKLKEFRKKANLSQEQIAEGAGLAEKHYGRLERGTCMPTLETFFKLIEFLKVPISEFGIRIDEGRQKKREELIKEIYLLNSKEIDAYINIIKIIKSLK